jgi:Flp pilus assembly protein TadD
MASQNHKGVNSKKQRKLARTHSHDSGNIRNSICNRTRIFTRKRLTRLFLVLLSGGLVGVALFVPQYVWRKTDTSARAKELHEQARAILFDQGGIYSSYIDDPPSIGRRTQLETARGLVEEALLLKAGGLIQSDLHNDLSAIYLEEKNFVRAEEEVKKAIAVDPKWAEANANLGDIFDITGRTQEAEAQYRLAIHLDPNNSHGYTGLCLLQRKQLMLTEAVSSARTASRLQPLNGAAWDCLGIALDYLGNHAEAEQAFRKALKLQPARPSLHRSLAISLSQQPDKAIDQSLAEIRAAIRLRPDNPEDWYVLAAILSTAGLSPEAHAAARKALELDPNNTKVAELLKTLPFFPGEIRMADAQYEMLLQKALSAPVECYKAR